MESTGTPIHNYTINAVSGGTTIKQLASGTCEESAGFATYVPKAIFYGGQYYVLDDAGLTNYQASFTMSTSDAVEEVNYTLDESVVAFWECENMNYGHAVFNSTNNSNLASNGGAVTIYGGSDAHTNTTISKGVYNISVAGFIWASGYADAFKLQYSTDNAIWNDVATINFASEENAVKTASNVIIPSDSYLRLLDVSGHTSRHYVDYLLVDKVADIIDANNEFVGAFDKSQEWAESSRYTLKMGETKVITFQNHGQDFGKNWKINVIEDGAWKSITRADSWDEKANGTGAATKVAYQVSKDGGSSRVALDWAEYQEDMADAYVVATLSYGIDGTLAITTTSTGTANGYIYYVDQDVTGLTKDLEISLSINYSWLEILSVDATATSVPVTLGNLGWATLYTPYALNFDGTGLTAYTATVEGTTVTLNEVKNVPANTGVVLSGNAGSYNIPTIASSETSKGDLIGNATEATAFDAVAGHTYYVLAPSEDSNFKVQFCPVTSGSIAAGKAFLDVAGAGVKAFSVKFADADAIRSIENESSMFNVESSKVYNLAGQRMSKLQKGINIVNGKKVLVK